MRSAPTCPWAGCRRRSRRGRAPPSGRRPRAHGRGCARYRRRRGPRSLMRRTKSRTLRTSSTASATVGSSRTMRSALKCMARPMAMPWRSPPESCLTVESTAMPTPRKPIDLVRISRGDRLLLLDVDEAEAVGDLAADEEVAPERLLLAERLVLVDGLDRQVMRHAHRVVVEVDLAGRGRRCGRRWA